jgi:hypothetical protein
MKYFKKYNITFLILFFVLFFIFNIFLKKKYRNEGFINNNKDIGEMMNENYSIKHICNQCNPQNKPCKSQFCNNGCRKQCKNLYDGPLKVPLYLYPSLHYHPFDEPN